MAIANPAANQSVAGRDANERDCVARDEDDGQKVDPFDALGGPALDADEGGLGRLIVLRRGGFLAV